MVTNSNGHPDQIDIYFVIIISMLRKHRYTDNITKKNITEKLWKKIINNSRDKSEQIMKEGINEEKLNL